jgi:hypothetical protein
LTNDVQTQQRQNDKIKKMCAKITNEKKNELNKLQTEVENLQNNLKSV